jgi:hypothetical protein
MHVDACTEPHTIMRFPIRKSRLEMCMARKHIVLKICTGRKCWEYESDMEVRLDMLRQEWRSHEIGMHSELPKVSVAFKLARILQTKYSCG